MVVFASTISATMVCSRYIHVFKRFTNEFLVSVVVMIDIIVVCSLLMYNITPNIQVYKIFISLSLTNSI